MACNDTKCREKIMDELKTKANKDCVLKRPSKTTISIIVGMLIIPSLITGINMYSQLSYANYVYASKEEPLQNERRIITLEQQMKDLLEDNRDIKQALKEQTTETKKGFDNIATLIMGSRQGGQ